MDGSIGFGSSLVAHVAVLVIAALSYPPLGTLEDDRVDETHLRTLIFVTTAERELLEPEESSLASTSREQLAMGDMEAPRTGERHGVAGANQEPDPSLARREGDGGSYDSWLALVPSRAAGPQEAVTTTDGYDLPFGADPIDANGAAHGVRIADSRGAQGTGVAALPVRDRLRWGYRCRLP